MCDIANSLPSRCDSDGPRFAKRWRASATPCSAKAEGVYSAVAVARLEITNCDLKVANGSREIIALDVGHLPEAKELSEEWS